jgi:hypothetical protein
MQPRRHERADGLLDAAGVDEFAERRSGFLAGAFLDTLVLDADAGPALHTEGEAGELLYRRLG